MSHSPRRLTAALAAAALAATGVVAFAAPAAAASGDLLISEYVEGSSFNKAIEIYNPSATAVDLAAAGYALQLFFNGSSTPTSFPLTGTRGGGRRLRLRAGTDRLDPGRPRDRRGRGSDHHGVAVQRRRRDRTGRRTASSSTSSGRSASTRARSGAPGSTPPQDNTLRRAADTCVGDENGTDAFDPTVGWVGYATNTFDGLGTHTADCGGEPPAARVVINEFSADTVGTADVEYVELLANPATTDLSAYRVLEIEGDFNGTVTGTVDEVISFGAADASGRSLATLANGALENGTVSLLLVTGTAPCPGHGHRHERRRRHRRRPRLHRRRRGRRQRRRCDGPHLRRRRASACRTTGSPSTRAEHPAFRTAPTRTPRPTGCATTSTSPATTAPSARPPSARRSTRRAPSTAPSRRPRRSRRTATSMSPPSARCRGRARHPRATANSCGSRAPWWATSRPADSTATTSRMPATATPRPPTASSCTSRARRRSRSATW